MKRVHLLSTCSLTLRQEIVAVLAWQNLTNFKKVLRKKVHTKTRQKRNHDQKGSTP